MAKIASLLLLLLGCGLSFGYIILQTTCPAEPHGDDSVCSQETCTTPFECGADELCCPNACGKSSCVVVRAPCTLDGKTYQHHRYMPFTAADAKPGRDCGDCYCQNGLKECITYNCMGPMP